jgi:osmotically-inducible protein OsmY
MTRNLGILLCCVSAVACATNRPADEPQGSTVATTTTTTTPPSDEPGMMPASSDSLDSRRSDSAATRSSDPFHHDGAATSAQSTTGPTMAPGSSATTSSSTTTTSGTKSEKDTGGSATQPDNTKVNQRDTKNATPTPMDQGEGQSDLDITKRIRQAVMGDKSLSFTAKNVKIITRDGKVVLRGPVNSADERASIAAAAQKVAGAGNVDNQLEVKK